MVFRLPASYHYTMSTNEEALALLVRRRAVFERLTTARDATNKGTSERVRLECVCEKSAVRLMEIANMVVESNAARHEILTALSPVPVSRRVSYVYKWKRRITHELNILSAALTHLFNAKQFLTVAAGDVFAGVPILRTRLDIDIGIGRKHNNNAMPSIQERHAEIAAAYIQAARDVCTYVRRAICGSLPLQLGNLPACIEPANAVPKKALETVSKVHRNVRKYEIQAKEQLAILAAEDAEMDCILLSTREYAINEALSSMPVSGTNTTTIVSISMSFSIPISSTERPPKNGLDSMHNDELPITCDSIAKLDMKRALGLLIALTRE